VNDTICANEALEKGGGIYGELGSSIRVRNSILWGNNASEGEAVYLESQALHLSELLLEYSDVEEGQTAVYLDPSGTLEWGEGMIDADPLFVAEAEGDFHLRYTSPFRDQGDSDWADWTHDIDANPRIPFQALDLGAYEFYRHFYGMGNATAGGNIKGCFVDLPGQAPVGLFLGCGAANPPLPTAWGYFYLEAPWCLIPLAPIPSSGVLTLSATIPPAPPPPYDLPMQALIGLEPDSLTGLWSLTVR